VNDLATHVLHRDPIVPGIPSSLHTKQFALKTNTNLKPGLRIPINEDSDPSFHVNADSDPAPHQSDANLRPPLIS
jgi:hypothetical protein